MKKVLISGAGIAGFMAYLMLDRKKYEVTLIEKAEDFRCVGYSITLWNCAFDILKKTIFRNDTDYEEHFVKLKKTYMISDRLPGSYKETFTDLGLTVDREELLKLFIRKSQKLKGKVMKGRHIKNIFHTRNSNRVVFSDGAQECYDLILNCEGIRSFTRDLVFSDVKYVSSKYSVEYFRLHKIPELYGNNVMFQINNLTGLVMSFPKKSIIAQFFLKDQKEYQQNSKRAMNKLNTVLKEKFNVKKDLERIHNTSKIFNLAEVHTDIFHLNRVVLLGDAAHGKLPTLGFGATLAIEDSYYLANLLNAVHMQAWDKGITKTLDEYAAARKSRIAKLYFLQGLTNKSSLPKEENRIQGHSAPDNKQIHILASSFDKTISSIFARVFSTLLKNYDIRKDIEKSMRKLSLIS